MHAFQKMVNPISILAVILLLLMSTLYQPAKAAMVGTEKLLISDRNQETRSYLQQRSLFSVSRIGKCGFSCYPC